MYVQVVVSVLVQPNEQFDIFRILLLCREAVFELYKWLQSYTSNFWKFDLF